MNSLIEHGIIKEQQCGNNFTYILENAGYFVSTAYKVLQSQSNSIFVQCMRVLYNGKLGIYYLTDDYRSLSAINDESTTDVLITIVTNLFFDVIEVRNNGFLSCQNIDISWDKIFVEPSTLKVKLVYLPINVNCFDSYAEFESELRANLIKYINGYVASRSDKIECLLGDLANASLTLEALCNRWSRMNLRTSNQTMTSVKAMNMVSSDRVRIVATNAPEYFEIVLNKDEIVIGKNPELVDAVISFNKMISRKHCKISKCNGSYYITDENSANGTYVNRIRVTPGELYPINKGDVIRLADSDFQVV